MQSLSDVVHLDLTSLPPPSSSSSNSTPMSSSSSSSTISISISGCLSIDEDEPTETRLRRMISEHSVIIFSRSSCCMCHVMKKLLATIGVQPTVIELDDREMASLPLPAAPSQYGNPSPALFIGGSCIGGLETLMALHLSGHLVPKLVQVGALWV